MSFSPTCFACALPTSMSPSSSPYLLMSRWAWRRMMATFSSERVQPRTSYRELNTSVVARSVLHFSLSCSTLELDGVSLLEGATLLLEETLLLLDGVALLEETLLLLEGAALLEEAMLLEEGRTASFPLRSSPTFSLPQMTS